MVFPQHVFIKQIFDRAVKTVENNFIFSNVFGSKCRTERMKSRKRKGNAVDVLTAERLERTPVVSSAEHPVATQIIIDVYAKV